MEILNAAVGLMSLVLGGFAIWLSFQFFVKGKESEKQTAIMLEGIKTQTEALQKLTGRWMDRLTRYATEPRPADEGLKLLLSTMADLPTTMLTHLRVQTLDPQLSGEALRTEALNCYIALYYYTAVANVYVKRFIPLASDFDASNPDHVNIQQLVDSTILDFNKVAVILDRTDWSRIQSSPLYDLFITTRDNWRPHVQTTQQILEADRVTQPAPSEAINPEL